MPADLYRDAHVGIRARLAELQARVRDREAELTDAFWSSLEPYVRERLAAMREALAVVSADSLDALARAEGLLSAYADELDLWIAQAPAMEEAWLEVPHEVDDPPPVPESGPQLSSDEGKEFIRSFTSTIAGVLDTTLQNRPGLGPLVRDAEVEIVEDGWWSCLARFRHRDAPFALRASALPTSNGQLGEVVMQLFTSVARATPRLLVRHESLFAAFGKAMGWRHEVQVGEPSFDGLFLIQGANQDVHRFLVPNVRALLLALARFDVPTLEIDPPRRVASLTWFFEPAVSPVKSAIRTLLAIRETPATISFRR